MEEVCRCSGSGRLGRARRSGLGGGALGSSVVARLYVVKGGQDRGVDLGLGQQLLAKETFVQEHKRNLHIAWGDVPTFWFGGQGSPHRIGLELDVGGVELVFDGGAHHKVPGLDELGQRHDLDHRLAEEVGHLLQACAVDGLDAAVAAQDSGPVGRLHLEAAEKLARLDALGFALSFDGLDKGSATREVHCRHVGQGVLVRIFVVLLGHGYLSGLSSSHHHRPLDVLKHKSTEMKMVLQVHCRQVVAIMCAQSLPGYEWLSQQLIASDRIIFVTSDRLAALDFL